MKDINKIKYYIAFIGWGRSGNSLIAALLDFHPNIYIKNEFQTLQERFKTQEEIFEYILKKREYKLAKGKSQAWGGFHHPRFKDMEKGVPLIIGGKKAGGTSNTLLKNKIGSPSILKQNPVLFKKFYDDIIKVPVKWIHVQRNPYDNITTIFTHKKKKWKVEPHVGRIRLWCIDEYFQQAEAVKKVLKERDYITVRLEEVIKNPKKEVIRICDHLEVDVYKEYLNHCENTVWDKPRQTRFNVDFWTEEMINLVREKMEEFNFMDGYIYDRKEEK
jgi:hypothetical protein